MIRKDLLISVLLKEEDELKQVDEIIRIKNQIGKLLYEQEYKFTIVEDEFLTN